MDWPIGELLLCVDILISTHLDCAHWYEALEVFGVYRLNSCWDALSKRKQKIQKARDCKLIADLIRVIAQFEIGVQQSCLANSGLCPETLRRVVSAYGCRMKSSIRKQVHLWELIELLKHVLMLPGGLMLPNHALEMGSPTELAKNRNEMTTWT